MASDPKQETIEQLNRRAESLGVKAKAQLSLDGLTIGLFTPDGLEFESQRGEDVWCHIDMMAIAEERNGK